MKTKLLVFAFSMFMSIFLHAQTTAIPDANFEQELITQGIDTDGTVNGSVATADISDVITLRIRSKNISDLTGIEGFSSLIQLDCSYNQLTSLNVTQNSALTEISVYENQLTTLDVSQNTALTRLSCPGNQLSTLDVTQNLDLISLGCGDNQLTSLNVSQNIALIGLGCAGNQLTNLDISQNTLLESLNCTSNQLTTLDVSQHTNLTDLRCGSNQLTSLNISQNTLLSFLYCSDNQLTNLDISQNTLLGNLFCSNNLLTNLNLNPSIRYLYCSNNQIQSLDLSQNTSLYALECEYNQLISIDVSPISNIHDLICNNNLLESLNVKNGNIWGLQLFNATNNPSLLCIEVDSETDANNNGGWQKDATATYSEDCVSFLGVDDEILAEGLKLYPNPVSDILFVESKLALKKIEIYSILGQRVKEINSDFNSISTNHLSRGIFLIKIYSEKGIAVRKLIKQ